MKPTGRVRRGNKSRHGWFMGRSKYRIF